MPRTPSLAPHDRTWIVDRARDAGFVLAGIVAAEDTPNDSAFADWLAAGHAAEMDYLARRDEHGDLLRGDLRRSMPWARSILVCAMNYDPTWALPAPLSIDPAPATTGWIARYAWSGNNSGSTSESMSSDSLPPPAADYHDVLLDRLRKVERDLHTRFGTDFESRCYVDTGPLLERGLAAQAGIGWIGKNTCVLHQEQGSWLLLAVIVTSLALAEAPPQLQPSPDRCGTCTRCIDACPTNALLATADPAAPRFMDAGRCIAYLTIEKKGTIPDDLRAPMGRHVFGCDICQDVCPWNQKASRTRANTPQPVAETEHPLAPRRQLVNPSLAWLASLDGPAFNRWFRGSPLERTRRRRILRNVAIAMGNSGDRTFLAQLDEWAADTAQDPILAESAAWAAHRLRAEQVGLKP